MEQIPAPGHYSRSHPSVDGFWWCVDCSVSFSLWWRRWKNSASIIPVSEGREAFCRERGEFSDGWLSLPKRKSSERLRCSKFLPRRRWTSCRWLTQSISAPRSSGKSQTEAVDARPRLCEFLLLVCFEQPHTSRARWQQPQRGQRHVCSCCSSFQVSFEKGQQNEFWAVCQHTFVMFNSTKAQRKSVSCLILRFLADL